MVELIPCCCSAESSATLHFVGPEEAGCYSHLSLVPRAVLPPNAACCRGGSSRGGVECGCLQLDTRDLWSTMDGNFSQPINTPTAPSTACVRSATEPGRNIWRVFGDGATVDLSDLYDQRSRGARGWSPLFHQSPRPSRERPWLPSGIKDVKLNVHEPQLVSCISQLWLSGGSGLADGEQREGGSASGMIRIQHRRGQSDRGRLHDVMEEASLYGCVRTTDDDRWLVTGRIFRLSWLVPTCNGAHCSERSGR
ncbi:hypothetical protein GGR56DRAFT_132407 [Xylariaceae sp. FL0804]|nr:hypothetical protein GGR56DRAFT_132407 [Xylariaceae sp. FL0804]